MSASALCCNREFSERSRSVLNYNTYYNVTSTRECDNLINFNNKQEFDKYRDAKNSLIQYYIINENSLNFAGSGINKNTFYRYIYGHYVRIFCSSCCRSSGWDNNRCKFNHKTNKQKRCRNIDRYLISVKQIQASVIKKNQYSYNVPICINHVDEGLCKSKCKTFKAYSLKNCNKCQQTFCKNTLCGCWKQSNCTKCIAQKEYNEKVKILQTIIETYKLKTFTDINIIKLLASFSGGYALKCCSCDNIIITDTKYQFQTKRNLNGRKIYYYKPKYLCNEQKPVTRVNGTDFRLFCAYCTKMKLIQCRFKTKDTCKIREINGLCGMHPYCVQCKLQDEIPLISCTKCRGKYCMKHSTQLFNECENCSIQQELRPIRRSIILTLKKIIEAEINEIEEISDVIARFVIGVIVSCCNIKCQREICIYNKYEFGRLFQPKKSILFGLGSYYIINRFKYSKYSKIEKLTIYGHHTRIFCVDCSETVKQCSFKHYSVQCKNYELISTNFGYCLEEHYNMNC
eukprot:427920_1